MGREGGEMMMRECIKTQPTSEERPDGIEEHLRITRHAREFSPLNKISGSYTISTHILGVEKRITGI